VLTTNYLTGGMPGQGKSTAIRAALLGLADQDGEVA
jgi:DNA segregation ATPase FtsK/SpoIIIE-like protein